MPMHSAHKDKATDYYTVFKVSRMGIIGGGGCWLALTHYSNVLTVSAVLIVTPKKII